MELPATETFYLRLHEAALDIGIEVNHTPYDTLCMAFALAVGAEAVVLSDKKFTRAMRTHINPLLAKMLVPLGDWATARGFSGPN